MLNRTNILALVGGGEKPKYPPNKVILWNEETVKEISEIKFSTEVVGVKMKRDKIFVLCEGKIYVFDFNSLEIIDSLDTNNFKCLLALSLKGNIIAYPDKEIQGYIRIKDYDSKKESCFYTHKTPLNCIKLNNEGTILATASIKGTLIRLYDTSNNNLIQEVRRGAESADVYCMTFDKTGKYFALTSDRKTTHIFFLYNNAGGTSFRNRESSDIGEKINTEEVEVNANRKSVFGGFANFLGVGKRYFLSEWSFTRFKLSTNQKFICTFGPDNTIIVITNDNKYYQASFDPNNPEAECIKIQEHVF